MISSSSSEGSAADLSWAGLDSLSDPVLVTQADGQLCYFNRAASGWFDLPSDVKQAQNLRVLLHEYTTGNEGMQDLWVALHRGRPWVKIVDLCSRDGVERKVKVALNPHRGAGRGDDLTVVQLHDVTELFADMEKREDSNRANLVLDLLGTTLNDLEYPLGALRWNADLPVEEFERLPEDLQRPFRSVQKASRHFVDIFSNMKLRLPESGHAMEGEGISLVRVLVAGSTPTRAAHLLDCLRSEGLRCVFRAAKDLQELVRASASGEVDAVLLDRHLGTEKRVSWALAVQENAPDMPVISCADISVTALAERLRSAMGRNQQVGSSDEVWRRIEEIALRDSLTGVLNRRAFERFGHQEFDRARRYGFPLSLALFDLDHFKSVNDQLGHPAGDRLLQVFASYLQTATRQSDMVARIGGDEFALLMSHTDGAGAFVLTQRLRDAVELHLREVLPPMDPMPGVSAGLIIYPDQEAESFDALVAKADEALYRAKRSGKGCLNAGE
ncbi:MAG: diguanylate cyclase [Planctomycetota bacterium]|nr:diguanylate cyclase [Planctomycetota bacterium]MDA1114541.1 diguanylate cyclase [Planctomycetota bacterium]